MGQRYVRLSILDNLIHYGLAIFLALPVFIVLGRVLLGYLGLFGLTPISDMTILGILGAMLIPPSLIAYIIQKEKLKFSFVKTAIDFVEFKDLIKEISKENRWTVRSFNNGMCIIKTNPGFVNQSWGQHLTLKLVRDGILVNSIFDPNKGSWLLTFGSNRKNINDIKKVIETRTQRQRLKTV